MTISTTTRKAGPYVGNGVTTAFAFAFKTFASTDVQVVLTDSAGAETALTKDVHYTVALNSDQNASPGGSITYPISGSALTSSQKLTVLSVAAETQSTDLVAGSGFSPETIEDRLDYITALIQQHAEKIARSILAAPSDSNALTALPAVANRAGKFLAFDASGNPTVSAGSGGGDTSLRTDLANSAVGTDGARLVGYRRTETGNVARDVATALRRTLHVDDFVTNTTPGTTNATSGIQAAITACPTGGRLVFGPGPYLIDANAIVFGKKMDTEWQDTVLYCPATAGQVALLFGTSASATFNTKHTGRLELYRSSAGGTYLPNHGGGSTAVSQLLGSGIKWLNMARMHFAADTYVAGFQYGHHWEANGAGNQVNRFSFLEGNDNLIDFYLANIDVANSFITRQTIADFHTTYNTAFYSSSVGTRFMETVRNNRTLDGLTVCDGTMQNAKERKLKHDGRESEFNVYWDVSNGGTDIELTANTQQNVLRGPSLRLQVVTDSSTTKDNSYVSPYFNQISKDGNTRHGWNGSNNLINYTFDVVQSLTDGSFVELPTGAIGWVEVDAGAEHGRWQIHADGSTVLLTGATVNCDAVGGAGKLGVYDVGANSRVVNRLGSTQTVVIHARYTL